MLVRLRNMLSRKFLVAVLTPVFTAILLKLNMSLVVPLDGATIATVVVALVATAIAYILGESVRDSVAASKNGK